MRVALDGRTIGPGETGVGRATRLLAEALGRTAPAGAGLEVFVMRAAAGNLKAGIGRLHPVAVRPTSHPLTELWEAAVLRRRLKSLGVDLFHAPAFRAPLLGGMPRVTTIHDLAAFTFPRTVPAKFRLYLRASVRHAMRASRLVLCPSEAVRAELEARFPRRRARVEAVPWGTPPLPELDPGEGAARRARLQLPESYVLGMGAGEPRKNHLRLLEAFALFKKGFGRKEDTRLVLCGAEAGQCPVSEEGCIDRLGLTSYIRRIGYLDLRDMTAVYQGAIALAYPSLYEGFGLPVLEAMSLGVPVLCSGHGAMAEVAGDSALLADPASSESVANGLERLLSSAALREDLANRGRHRARLFRWDDTGAAHWRLYQEVLQTTAAPGLTR